MYVEYLCRRYRVCEISLFVRCVFRLGLFYCYLIIRDVPVSMMDAFRPSSDWSQRRTDERSGAKSATFAASRRRPSN